METTCQNPCYCCMCSVLAFPLYDVSLPQKFVILHAHRVLGPSPPRLPSRRPSLSVPACRFFLCTTCSPFPMYLPTPWMMAAVTNINHHNQHRYQTTSNTVEKLWREQRLQAVPWGSSDDGGPSYVLLLQGGSTARCRNCREACRPVLTCPERRPERR